MLRLVSGRTPILLLLLPLLSGCLDSIQLTDPEFTSPEEVSFAPSLGIDLAQFRPTEGGVWIRDLEPGEGSGITLGQLAGIYYSGWVSDGHEFDRVAEGEGPPAEFVLGSAGPILGLTRGVFAMRLGGERVVLVPPSLGFGAVSLPSIPPNSWLVLRIRLARIDGVGLDEGGAED
jgi:hypothetical protein